MGRQWAIVLGSAVLAVSFMLPHAGLPTLTQVFAQETPVLSPVATLSAGDFRALAITETNRLLVTDSENEQVRVYAFEGGEPTLITTVDLNGEPLFVRPVEDYGLVVVEEADGAATLQTLARARFGRSAWEAFPLLDMSAPPAVFEISPDGRWGVVGGRELMLLEIASEDQVTSRAYPGPVTAAAFSEDGMFWASAAQLSAAPIARGPSLGTGQTVRFPAAITALAVAEDGTLGIALLADDRLFTFNPASLELGGSIALRGPFPLGVRVLTLDGALWAAVPTSGGRVVTLIDLRDAAAPRIGQELALETPIRAFTTAADRLVLSDGTAIAVFAP
jgi:hypothetical protein